MLRIILVSAIVTIVHGGVPQKRPIVPQSNERIVGGEPVNIENYPYQLSLLYYGSHICGASIISETVVLTAAHCTDGSSANALSVRAGSSYRGSGGQVVSVSKISQHPNYNDRTTDYDISVLHLGGSLSFGSGVQIVGLLAAGVIVPPGTKSVSSGWGALKEGGSFSNQLQAVVLPVISEADCKAAYGSSYITARMICAGYINGRKDACQGDTGGPLVANGVQIGIISWGNGCARPITPRVFANVSNLRNYIKSVADI